MAFKSLTELTIPVFRWLFMDIYFSVREVFMFGSRKSGKTKHIAMRLVFRCMVDKDYNALAMRKNGVMIKKSIQAEIQWAINYLGVAHLWTLHITNREFTYLPYKNKIIMSGISMSPFTGMPTMSGLNVPTGWIQDVWMEECWEFTEADYKMIRQTVRGGRYTLLMTGNPYFKEIWCVKKAMEIFMPDLETLKDKGEMWSYFAPIRDGKKVLRLETIVQWNNFQCNTKLSQEDVDERWEEERTNPKDFIVTGYGYPGSPSGTILGDLVDNIQERDLNYFTQMPTKYKGGVDVGLEYDATTASFSGLCPWGEMITAQGYYHSNGLQVANKFSDNGVWRHKSPHEMASDVIDYFMMFKDIWRATHPDGFKVSVDNADSAFIAILNKDCENRGIDGIKFQPTKGVKEDKKRIERRITAERQMLSRKMVSFLVIKDDDGKVLSYPTRLRYEMETIPWKQTMTGVVRLERDGSKVHPDMTNAWEYSWRAWLNELLQKVQTIPTQQELLYNNYEQKGV